MKLGLFAGILILSGCCRTKYDVEEYPNPAVQLNLNYHYGHFSSDDTVFMITTHFYTGVNSYTDVYHSKKAADSQRFISLKNVLNAEKIIIESGTSHFYDTINEISYNSKNVQIGNKRCGYTLPQYFNVHGSYRGAIISSGDDPTMQVNVAK